jgi:arsenite methyltransferase
MKDNELMPDGKKAVSRAYEIYESKSLLGEAFHPGGLDLTTRTAEIAGVGTFSFVLDICSGIGTSAIFSSSKYGCRVISIDLSSKLTSIAQRRAKAEKLSQKVSFIIGDAENLPFRGAIFDVVMSECSFSLLPNKKKAASEIKRVLKPGGKFVLNDIILRGHIDKGMQTQASFFLCIAGAMSLEDYLNLLQEAGFTDFYTEDYSRELRKMGYQILIRSGGIKNFLANISVQPSGVSEDITHTREVWQRLFREGKPGYALISVTKPDNQ